MFSQDFKLCLFFLSFLKKHVVTKIYYFQERAYEDSQKYKEGKFIIELIHMIKDNGWR